MQLQIFDDMAQCTDTAVSQLLPMVSPQRREQALRFSHTFGRFCCLKGYELLLRCIGQLRNATDPESRELRARLDDWSGAFVYNEHGKPFLQSRSTGGRIEGAEFSISHCKNAVAAALHHLPVGLDIETFRSFSPTLLHRTMNAQEAAAITGADLPQREFARLWTQKEAVLKLEGSGLTDNLPQVLSNRHYQLETAVNESKKYAWTVAQI